MKKLFILFFLEILCFTSIKAQESNAEYIKFEYSVSHIVCKNVEIIIRKSYTEKNCYEVNVKYCKNMNDDLEKQLKIDAKQFNKILNQFTKIKSIDLINNYLTLLDTSTISIEAGLNPWDNYYSALIKYDISTIYKGQPNSKACIKTIQMILKVAEVKIKDYN